MVGRAGSDRPRFGTDGVRGRANVELTAELSLAIGRAAARVLAEPGRPILVGRDTRVSGDMLQAGFSAGVAAEGVDVVDLGVLPTAGVAFAASVEGAPAAVISASHNPFYDNGIKLFAAGGFKLDHSVEAEVEAAIEQSLSSAGPVAPGRLDVRQQAATDYHRHLVNLVGPNSLSGLSVVLDCAHGAASGIAPGIFEEAGARLRLLGCQPNGVNINERAGCLHLDHLAEAVRAAGADFGLAFDGDADRVLAVDESGEMVDGDHILAILALDMDRRGKLAQRTVVATVMANLGFHRAMREAGIEVVETPVGDRYVLEAIEERSLCLGGEQSGHIVLRELATTGDGILTGLMLAEIVKRCGPLGALASSAMTRLPQVLLNVKVADPSAAASAPDTLAQVSEVEARLGGSGRVLIRPSGTEPVLRVMVEAEEESLARECAELIAISAGGQPT
jgi:phosphoglucosamine mutase